MMIGWVSGCAILQHPCDPGLENLAAMVIPRGETWVAPGFDPWDPWGPQQQQYQPCQEVVHGP